jgi:hypothetical protein
LNLLHGVLQISVALAMNGDKRAAALNAPGLLTARVFV